MQNKVKPLKQFGQNYIQDKNIILKIINTIAPEVNDYFIEIGPGLGSLTFQLIDKVKKLIAIEIDKRVIEDLSSSLPELFLINSDILEFDFNSINNITQDKVRVAGNIPYNITSPILFKLIENRHRVKDAHLMMQYEVAKRIVSKPKTKDYGILSVVLNYFTKTELCFKISPNVFYPKPKVDSAIVRFSFIDNQNCDKEFDELFIKVVKAAFANRRKTLKNSLSNSIFGSYNLENIEMYHKNRAEELTIDNFVEITQIFKEEYDRRKTI